MSDAIKQVVDYNSIFEQDNFLLSFSSPTAHSLTPSGYKIYGVIKQREYEFRVNKIEEIEQRPVEVWQSMGHAEFKWNDAYFRISSFARQCRKIFR